MIANSSENSKPGVGSRTCITVNTKVAPLSGVKYDIKGFKKKYQRE